jgi:hypothetical protein
VQLLLDRGAKIEDKDVCGNSPLAVAAWARRPFNGETLNRAGADVNYRNKKRINRGSVQ